MIEKFGRSPFSARRAPTEAEDEPLDLAGCEAGAVEEVSAPTSITTIHDDDDVLPASVRQAIAEGNSFGQHSKQEAAPGVEHEDNGEDETRSSGTIDDAFISKEPKFDGPMGFPKSATWEPEPVLPEDVVGDHRVSSLGDAINSMPIGESLDAEGKSFGIEDEHTRAARDTVSDAFGIPRESSIDTLQALLEGRLLPETSIPFEKGGNIDALNRYIRQETVNLVMINGEARIEISEAHLRRLLTDIRSEVERHNQEIIEAQARLDSLNAERDRYAAIIQSFDIEPA
ncbi:hypothetical protein [Croceicoccus gelatinilyticus]|uniref:hypothetical protein n=1 Tax=Croceicoccus gelatinilyticus TaxID=2835536 RepID=UPI001BCBA80D|nr:hypothetical protein [Croceicoccus gelatinilyticus]MBS7671732.1 hypothetical protein [Croceicoccus gelatinilyticus]